MNQSFTEEQKRYLAGFTAGFEAVRSRVASLRVLNQEAAPTGPEHIHRQAQDRFLTAGKKLSPEEQAKRDTNPLDRWDDLDAAAQADQFPKGLDVFLAKFHGLFFVAPAQNSFMCRLRLPGGIMTSHQFRGVADIAAALGGGYADVTTRANLQIREIAARHATEVLTGLHGLGIVPRGSGADNIRNITASPTAGIDPHELIDTRALARRMHHYILHHREMYGLPRKFNIAFDGGGTISSLADTNDVGFAAVRVAPGGVTDGVTSGGAGIYFRLQLGGITGHGDFARDAGVLLREDECIPVAAALVRVFIDHGDRTDRKKARLKYLLDAWGVDKYLAEAEKHLPFRLRRFPLEHCEPRAPVAKHGHVGFHPQRQPGLCYLGVVMPVGRLRSEQMRGLADIADRYGSGIIRLTVWQNLLISDIPREHTAAVKAAIEALGLHWSATAIRGALVACTGSAGCKYAAADTKAHAMMIADYLEPRVALDQPINIHLTGCHHSCAQHYIGDIGLLATKVERGEEIVEGYHVFVGGGYESEQAIARQVATSVPFDQVPGLIERLLRCYLENRRPESESFHQFTARQSTEALATLLTQTEPIEAI